MSRMRFLIIEGAMGTGKTSVAGHLIKKATANMQDMASIVYLNASITYAPLKAEEKTMPTTVEDNIAHLERICDTLTWLAEAAALYGTTDQWCCVDSLHITQCLRPGLLSIRQAMDFDARLKKIPRNVSEITC